MNGVFSSSLTFKSQEARMGPQGTGDRHWFLFF